MTPQINYRPLNPKSNEVTHFPVFSMSSLPQVNLSHWCEEGGGSRDRSASALPPPPSPHQGAQQSDAPGPLSISASASGWTLLSLPRGHCVTLGAGLCGCELMQVASQTLSVPLTLATHPGGMGRAWDSGLSVAS